MSFGDQLKTLRVAKGMSQKQLADAAGLSQQAVATYELNTREPGWSAVQRLASVLGVDCRAFQAEGDAPPPPPAKPGRPKKAAEPGPPAEGRPGKKGKAKGG